MQRILKRSALVFAVALLAPAAGAAASGTTSSTTPGTPAPAAGKATLRLPDIFVVGRNAVTVSGRRVVISGTVKPYVPGQFVTLKARIGRHVFRHARLRIKPGPGGSSGRFSLPIKSSATGIVAVSVVHHRSRTLSGFSATRR